MIPSVQLTEAIRPVLPRLGLTPYETTKALVAPYLTLDGADEGAHKFTEEDAKAAALFADDGLIRTPFPAFRFCMKSPNTDCAFGYCERNEGKMRFLMRHRFHGNGTAAFFAVCEFTERRSAGAYFSLRVFDAAKDRDVTDAMLGGYQGVKTDLVKLQVSDVERKLPSLDSLKQLPRAQQMAYVKKLRREVQEAEAAIREKYREIELLEEAKRSIASNENLLQTAPVGSWIDPASNCENYLRMLMMLSYQYLVPFHFVARVQPEGKGRSVEWVKAREHYTYVHRHHPANTKEATEGGTFDDNRHSQRVAHSRRAHTKLLTHPRWKNSVGKRVFVRASWCGPKEWKDTAGQIYQILERPSA